MTETRERAGQPGHLRSLVRDERVRYLMVGATGAGIFYAVFALGWLMSSGRIPYLALVLVANASVALVTFRFYRNQVFRSDTALFPGFIRFYIICLSSLVGSLTIVPLLIEFGKVPVVVAPIVYLALQPFVYYPINKFWVFRRRHRT